MPKKPGSKVILPWYEYQVLALVARRGFKIQYRVLLQKIDGMILELRHHSVNKITRDADSLYISRVKKAFPAVAEDLESLWRTIRHTHWNGSHGWCPQRAWKGVRFSALQIYVWHRIPGMWKYGQNRKGWLKCEPHTKTGDCQSAGMSEHVLQATWVFFWWKPWALNCLGSAHPVRIA